MSGTNVVSGLKEPPLPLSQEGLGQQTSPNEGQAKRERVSGHKGPPPPGQTWGNSWNPAGLGRLLWTDSRPAG